MTYSFIRPEQYEALERDHLQLEREFEMLEIAHQGALRDLDARSKEINAARVDCRVLKANWEACRKIVQWYLDQGYPEAPHPALIDCPEPSANG